MPDRVAIVLAAGKGTRMKSRFPKAIHRLCGKPMARYAVDLSREVGVDRVIVIVGHEAEMVRDAVGQDVEYAVQVQQLGTGDAARQASALLSGFEGTVLLLQADSVLVTSEMLAGLLKAHEDAGAAATLLSAVVEDPAQYGRILRGSGGGVERIVERKDATPEIAAIREINAGTYCFDAAALFEALERIRPNNVQGEYYLTDVIGLLASSGKQVLAHEAEDAAAALGVNDRVELASASQIIRERLLRNLMIAGVTIIDPATTYVEAEVEVGTDTVIHPMSVLAGRTRIGSECEIGPLARITDCTVGDGAQVHNSVLAGSEVGDGAKVGPFAQLRPGCKVGPRCKVGNFVELKKSELEESVSVGHHSYIGDSFIGARTNIGAGTITCNYDGKSKHVTRIGQDAFIGSHATLVAPVEIGDGAYVGAGSPITKDVPPDALAVARSHQIVKEDWARKRREKA